MRINHINIKVPATTANLGPGFDVLGGSLEIFNELDFYPDDDLRLEVYGIDNEIIKREDKNLLFETIKYTCEYLNKDFVKGRFVFNSNIPIEKGLGSSATAIIMGVLLPFFYYKEDFDKEEVLKIAIKIEGHPDNVVPAFFGGIRLSYKEQGKIKHIPLKKPNDLDVVLIVPHEKISTKIARSILPKEIPLKDAIFNISRVGLIVYALENSRYDLLKVAFEDSIHQDKRMNLLPNLKNLFEKILNINLCLGGWLSGSGSSLAFLYETKNSHEFIKICKEIVEKEKFNANIISTKFSEIGTQYSIY